MSSIGVGVSVFSGMLIGVAINHPDMPFDILVSGSAMWGLLVGFLFRIYQMAFDGLTPPFRRNR